MKKEILQMFYSSTIRSVLTFGSVCWGGNISQRDKDRLEKLIKRVSGIVGQRQDSFDHLNDKQLIDKFHIILTDDAHPLRHDFDSRRISRSGRFRAPQGKTNRYQQSFVPRAIRTCNRRTEREHL